MRAFSFSALRIHIALTYDRARARARNYDAVHSAGNMGTGSVRALLSLVTTCSMVLYCACVCPRLLRSEYSSVFTCESKC